MSDLDAMRKIAVILVADVVGYSKHMEQDEKATLEAYAECENLLKDLLEKRNGSIFNTAGDSVLAEFTSAVNAVEFAVEFQNKIMERNKSENIPAALEFRIGINMGDVVSREGNLLGDGVNIAARLEALSQPNGVCISKSIYDLVVPKIKMTFNDLGVQKVKQNSFHAYDILLNPSQKRKIKSEKSKIPLISAVVLLLGAVLIGYFLQGPRAEPIAQNDKRVLLVKPFDYLTDDDSKKFIADSMLNVLVTGLSGYSDLKILSKNTSKLVKEQNLSDGDLAKQYGANLVLSGSITVYGTDMRTSFELRSIKDDKVLYSDLKNTQTKDLFQLQDDLVISVLEQLKLDEDKVRVSNEGVETLDELRLLHFAAKEREKWSRDSYPQYEQAVEKLYSLNPDGYTHNVSQGWKYHYKMRLGLCVDGADPADARTKCMIEAVKFAERAIEINPSKADAYLAKSYYLSALYLINSGTDRKMEWGGLKSARDFAEKGYLAITDDPYQFGLAGEAFTLSNDFEKGTDAFSKLFAADANPGDTFTSFYMQSSYLNNDLAMVESLASRIISENEAREVDNCYKPFCGNAAFAYLFLIYVAHNRNDEAKMQEYLNAFRTARNKYSRDDWMGFDNPFHFIWKPQATKITNLMDELGW